MIEIKEVTTKNQQKEFLNFPLKLYKDNPCFVPPLYSDERKIFRKDYVYYETSEAVYYNAYRNGVMVGRISGILQKAHNEKTGQKRIRFTRFDSINDQEVASALFGAVEDWGRSKGMDTICGPLGFSDLEREGLLIEGFEYLATFEEQYNADYYQTLISNLGYEKEVDWTESQLRVPASYDGELAKMSEIIMKRSKLHYAEAKNTNEFVRRHQDKFFSILDESYSNIYGTVPFTDGMKKMLIDNFKLIINIKYVGIVLNEKEEPVAFGLAFPSLARAVQKSGGRLTPACLFRILRDVRHPKIIDLGLVGVSPKYANSGASAIVCSDLIKLLQQKGVEFCETNLNLEENYAIQNQWKRFDETKHKRRRSYIKAL